MIFKNLTPHPITLKGENGSVTLETERDEKGEKLIPRVSESLWNRASYRVQGIKVPGLTKEFGDVRGLPKQNDGVMLIVSSLIAERSNRNDLLFPTEFERDKDGNIIGARALAAFHGKGKR